MIQLQRSLSEVVIWLLFYFLRTRLLRTLRSENVKPQSSKNLVHLDPFSLIHIIYLVVNSSPNDFNDDG